MGQTGPYTACAVLARYGYGKGLEAAVMALYDPRNDKPPSGGNGGLTRLMIWPYAEFADRRKAEFSLLNRLVNLPCASAHLVGETTRRYGLNLDRGGQPQDAQRVAGKREWHRETGKCSPQRMAPSVITPHDPIEAFLRLNRADSPSVIYLYRG